jgi:hypothetical protein
MADTKLTVVHALFRYVDDEGRERFAMRGETVDFPDAEAKRGLRLEALAKPGEAEAAPEPAKEDPPLGDFPADGDEAAQDAWIGKAKVNDVVDEANRHPEAKEALIAAETRRGENARSTLLEALAK